MSDIKRYTIIRDGRLYDSSDDRAQAIQFCRSFQERYKGTWQVLDRKNDNQEEYRISSN